MRLKMVTVVHLRDFFPNDEAYQDFCSAGEIQNHLTWGGCDFSLVSIKRFLDLISGLKKEKFPLNQSDVWEGVTELREFDANLVDNSKVYINL